MNLGEFKDFTFLCDEDVCSSCISNDSGELCLVCFKASNFVPKD